MYEKAVTQSYTEKHKEPQRILFETSYLSVKFSVIACIY